MYKYSSILIVEDSLADLKHYVSLCQKLSLSVVTATNVQEAREKMQRHGCDLALVDLHLTAMEKEVSGIKVIHEFCELWPNSSVVAMSSDFHDAVCRKALRAGAQHFLRKPISSGTELSVAFNLAYERKRLLIEKEQKFAPYSLAFSPKSQALQNRHPYGLVLSGDQLKAIEIVTKHPHIPFIILGETGTGKEEIAKLVHKKRCEEEGVIPFVTVNCASLSHDLIESLLFGHRKGAFTGADKNTAGFLGEANGGILFLDEIHCLNIEAQSRLLRVLNNGSYHRLGDTAELYSQFQVIAASTIDLDEQVEDGRFVLDLRSRLTGIDLHLKPLRARMNEIGDLIALYFVRSKLAISDQALSELIEKCSKYYWRGNIRQLYKALEIMVIQAQFQDEPLSAKMLPEFKTMLAPAELSEIVEEGISINTIKTEENLISIDLCLEAGKDLKTIMDELEAHVIKKSMSRYPRLSDLCRDLGISRNTLDLKRKKYRLK